MIKTITLFVCLSAALSAQTFEAASIKKNTTGEKPGGDLKGSTLVTTNMPLKPLIARSYGVANDKVVAPAWVDTDGFDITAKVPPGASEDAVIAMIRNMLVDRFKLAVHHDSAAIPVYALVVAKGGPKLHPSSAADTRSACKLDGRQLTCKNEKITMTGLAQNFPRWMSMNWFDMPIVDQTGLTGEYDVTITWTLTDRMEQPVDPPGMAFLDALQEQLGLKLERRKAAVDKVIVDHIERTPTEN